MKMKMKYFLLACVPIFIISSCSKNDSLFVQNIDIKDVVIEVEPDYLHFDIRPYKYDNSLPDPFVRLENTQVNYVIHEYSQENQYIWFLPSVEFNHKDSLYFIFTIRYFPDNTSSKIPHYDLQFVYYEAKNKLKENMDGSFTYVDNKDLYDILLHTEWESQTHESQVLVSFPETFVHDSLIIEGITSSNGFIFEDEQFTVSKVEWDDINHTIKLAGSFNVYMKGLSCGFYNFYEIEKANFTAPIK